MAPESPLLTLQEVDAGYGPVRVLFGVSLTVHTGEVVALLGRNGAGKTTTLRAILGLAAVTRGRVSFAGADLGEETTDRRARRGIGYVPQDRRIFAGLTVRENLEVGRRAAGGAGPGWSVEGLLSVFPALAGLLEQDGGRLSGGEQQMLAVARALMGNPRLVLLDEPSEGLAPVVVQALADQVGRLRAGGVAVLMSEQNLRFTGQVSDRVYVLEGGQTRLEGSLSSPATLESARTYLTI
jgi:branched-chain amino acid transport system ATP-binding protein